MQRPGSWCSALQLPLVEETVHARNASVPEGGAFPPPLLSSRAGHVVGARRGDPLRTQYRASETVAGRRGDPLRTQYRLSEGIAARCKRRTARNDTVFKGMPRKP